jgi:hypothetical protein
MRRLLTLTVIVVLARPLGAQSPSVPRWQYAELNVAAGVVSWTTGDSMSVFVNGIEEAAKAFGLPEHRGTGVLMQRVLNSLGNQSWELVSVTKSQGTTYYFKRRMA